MTSLTWLLADNPVHYLQFRSTPTSDLHPLPTVQSIHQLWWLSFSLKDTIQVTTGQKIPCGFGGTSSTGSLVHSPFYFNCFPTYTSQVKADSSQFDSDEENMKMWGVGLFGKMRLQIKFLFTPFQCLLHLITCIYSDDHLGMSQ